jgi:hypothetical protein
LRHQEIETPSRPVGPTIGDAGKNR